MLSVGAIIFLSSFIYTTMFYAISGIEQPTLDYLEEYSQEEFSVEMSLVITPSERQRINEQGNIPDEVIGIFDLKRYDAGLYDDLMESRKKTFLEHFPETQLEKRYIKEFYFETHEGNHRALILRDSESINLSYIEEGKKPDSENEIALTSIYAKKNNLELGDKIEIQGKRYEICGFVLFPDYTFPMIGMSLNIDTGKTVFLLGTDDTFDEMRGDRDIRIAGVFDNNEIKDQYTEKFSEVSFISEKLDFVTEITLTENQVRSGAIFDELRIGKIFSLGFSIIIAVIAVFITSLLISKILNAQKGQIGLLKALGYRNGEIAFPYIVLIIFSALPALFAGYFVGTIVAQPMKYLYLDFFLLPSERISQSFSVFSTAVFVPLVSFAAISAAIIFKMLSKRPLELLHTHRKERVNRLTRLVGKVLGNVKSKTKYKYLYILGNTVKFLVFFVGIVMSAVLVFIGFMMGGMADRLTIESYKMVDYKYEAYIDVFNPPVETGEGKEKFLRYPDVSFNGNTVTGVGLEPDNKLYNLFDSKGNNITGYIEDDAVVSKSLSVKYSVSPGDDMRIMIDGREYTVNVKDVAIDYSDDRIFLNIKTLSAMVTNSSNENLYSGGYSLERPSENDYEVVIDKESIMEQAEAMQGFIRYAVALTVAVAIIIAVLILFVLASISVEDNYYNISLLKVMGYKSSEVSSMVLGSYLVYTIVSFIISVPVSLALLQGMVGFFATEYNLVFPMELNALHVLFAFLIILGVFFAGTLNGKRKISKIPLQEILKAYAET